MIETPLRPLSPLLHRLYAPMIAAVAANAGAITTIPPRSVIVPSTVISRVSRLLSQRIKSIESDVDDIDAEIVKLVSWYVVRPDEIASDVLKLHGWRSPLTIDQATIVLAACGEAGYSIVGNGAPDYNRARWLDPDPVRGAERDGVIWSAARYWARSAARLLNYVSLGDSRGFMPRSVQYDQPGSVHPQQRASLTLGPASDERNSIDYMRRRTRRLVLVRA